MVTDILENEDYKDLVCTHIKETIDFLLEHNKEFSITANVEATTFNPDLPGSIKSQLQKFSLFTLANYTYTTIVVDDDFISFEAGFGAENFGSVVKVPLQSIFQIVIDDSILYLNPVATVEKFNKKEEKKDSMSVFKNNPNNKRFS